MLRAMQCWGTCRSLGDDGACSISNSQHTLPQVSKYVQLVDSLPFNVQVT